MSTEAAPLAISIISVAAADFFPSTRSASVGPALPLPYFFISIPYALPIRIDGEILPSRYETITHSKRIKFLFIIIYHMPPALLTDLFRSFL